MSTEHRNKRFVTLCVLLVSLSLNGVLATAYMYQQIQIAFASEQIETFVDVAKSRSGAEAAEYIGGYYRPGTKLQKGSSLSNAVECIRNYLVDGLNGPSSAMHEHSN